MFSHLVSNTNFNVPDPTVLYKMNPHFHLQVPQVVWVQWYQFNLFDIDRHCSTRWRFNFFKCWISVEFHLLKFSTEFFVKDNFRTLMSQVSFYKMGLFWYVQIDTNQSAINSNSASMKSNVKKTDGHHWNTNNLNGHGIKTNNHTWKRIVLRKD